MTMRMRMRARMLMMIANKTMQTVADHREREARRIATERSQPARAAASD